MRNYYSRSQVASQAIDIENVKKNIKMLMSFAYERVKIIFIVYLAPLLFIWKSFKIQL